MKLNQITVGCLDYEESVTFYKSFGLVQIVDAPPHYARFETPTGETFSIHQVDAVGTPSTVIYFELDQLDETVATLKTKGIKFAGGPRDESWGWREARLFDPAGNPLCLFHAGENRRFPAWRIATHEIEKGETE